MIHCNRCDRGHRSGVTFKTHGLKINGNGDMLATWCAPCVIVSTIKVILMWPVLIALLLGLVLGKGCL